MRHNKSFNHLGRKVGHRKAMLTNMACSLVEHKRITTTVAKAKALKTFVEPIITKAKTDSMHSRRMAFRYLGNKRAVTELFGVIAPKVGDRPGGYTRIIKTGFRLGDAAEMCMIELVDFNEIYTTAAPAKKTRRRRGGKAAAPKTTEVAEEVKAEEAPKADKKEDKDNK
ncbi:MAG: 50S ribosomal protein L17 [Salibacteraceae bacterium]